MIEVKDLPKIKTPSARALAKATGIAVFIAAVLLFAVILPAEYGFDPLHSGAALGLTALSKSTAGKAEPTLKAADGQPALSVVTLTAQPKTYKVDAEDLVLHPGQGVELKYHMQRGAVMVYSWKASGKLRFEFHGEPDQKPNPDYYDSYELDDQAGKDHAFGSFTAPSTGIHGWFWENKGDQNVDLRLTTAGFYDGAKMFAGGDPEDIPVDDVK
jgi:hypothetical protein